LLTDKEIKDAIGTPFDYVISTGRVIPAFIAAYEPEKGFTCLASGEVYPDDERFLDSNGNLCLIGIPRARFHDREAFIEMVEKFFNPIMDTGTCHFIQSIGGGAPQCSIG